MVHLLQGIYAISYAHDWQGLSYLHIITVMTLKELIVISTNMFLTILKHKHVYITKLHKKIYMYCNYASKLLALRNFHTKDFRFNILLIEASKEFYVLFISIKTELYCISFQNFRGSYPA